MLQQSSTIGIFTDAKNSPDMAHTKTYFPLLLLLFLLLLFFFLHIFQITIFQDVSRVICWRRFGNICGRHLFSEVFVATYVTNYKASYPTRRYL